LASVNQLQVTATTYAGGLNTLYFNGLSNSVTFTITNGGLYAIFAVVDPADGASYSRAEAYAFNTDEKYMLPGVNTWTPDDFGGKIIAGVEYRAAVSTQLPIISITG
jgi:hypothetical protein